LFLVVFAGFQYLVSYQECLGAKESGLQTVYDYYQYVMTFLFNIMLHIFWLIVLCLMCCMFCSTEIRVCCISTKCLASCQWGDLVAINWSDQYYLLIFTGQTSWAPHRLLHCLQLAGKAKQ